MGYRQNLFHFHQGGDCVGNRPVPTLLPPSSHVFAPATKAENCRSLLPDEFLGTPRSGSSWARILRPGTPVG